MHGYTSQLYQPTLTLKEAIARVNAIVREASVRSANIAKIQTSKTSKTYRRHLPMWEVWFYAPGSGRNFLDRFNTRSEAEAYRQRFLRLVGTGFKAVVCSNPPKFPELPES